jgi:hypothetical protein
MNVHRQNILFIHKMGRGIARRIGVKYLGLLYKGSGEKEFYFRDPVTDISFTATSLWGARNKLNDQRSISASLKG